MGRASGRDSGGCEALAGRSIPAPARSGPVANSVPAWRSWALILPRTRRRPINVAPRPPGAADFVAEGREQFGAAGWPAAARGYPAAGPCAAQEPLDPRAPVDGAYGKVRDRRARGTRCQDGRGGVPRRAELWYARRARALTRNVQAQTILSSRRRCWRAVAARGPLIAASRAASRSCRVPRRCATWRKRCSATVSPPSRRGAAAGRVIR